MYIKFKSEEEKEDNDVYDEKKSHNTLELQCEAVKKLAKKLDYVTILKKGKFDIISNGYDVIYNDTIGSLKRCGGIGDILTGTLTTFTYWCHLALDNGDKLNNQDANLIACYAASVFLRECSRIAFNKFHRSTLAIDIIEQIGETFYKLFDKD